MSLVDAIMPPDGHMHAQQMAVRKVVVGDVDGVSLHDLI